MNVKKIRIVQANRLVSERSVLTHAMSFSPVLSTLHARFMILFQRGQCLALALLDSLEREMNFVRKLVGLDFQKSNISSDVITTTIFWQSFLSQSLDVWEMMIALIKSDAEIPDVKMFVPHPTLAVQQQSVLPQIIRQLANVPKDLKEILIDNVDQVRTQINWEN